MAAAGKASTRLWWILDRLPLRPLPLYNKLNNDVLVLSGTRWNRRTSLWPSYFHCPYHLIIRICLCDLGSYQHPTPPCRNIEAASLLP